MLTGKCPKCEYQCVGWALRFPRNQSCPNCGTGLEVKEGNKIIFTGYSPFTAEEYSIDLPTQVNPSPTDEKDNEK